MPSPDVRISVAYDDDAAVAAEALLAVLRRPGPATEADEHGADPEQTEEAA